MKKLLGLTLLAVAMLGINTVSAQKFARINLQEIVMAMPKTAEAETNLNALQKDWVEQLEQIQVEINNKYADYQKNQATMTAANKQVREKELVDLQQRLQEVQQLAQQELQKKEHELMEPIQKEAQDAINKVAKANNYIAVFNTAIPSLIYVDESQLVDIAPLVKKELGIVETPAKK